MRSDFYKKYNSKIVPLVQKYEETRGRKLFLAVLLSATSTIIGLVILLYSHNISIEDNDIFFKLAFLFFGLAFYVWYKIKKSFEKEVKEEIMPIVCDCLGNLKWTTGYYSGGNIFSDSYAVPNFEYEIYDDIFQGSYKDVNIDIIEAKFKEIYYKRGRKRKRTVFKGVIVKLDMNKSFTGHTVIQPSSLIKLAPSKKLHYTTLEDVAFNKRFDVYTNDEVDARYLITPTFMERLKNVKIAFSAQDMGCVFYENFLLITLPSNKDIFSICSLVKKMDDSRQYFKMYEEILTVIKLIDHLKMYQKIGL